MKKYIGTKLYAALQAHGLSQTELSKMTGVGTTVISKILSGLRPASEEQMERFAQALKYPKDYFLKEDTVTMNAHVETQHGGNGNQYLVHNGDPALIAAKDAVIAAKNEVIAAKDAVIEALKEQIKKEPLPPHIS